jgi:histone deacetylase 1/2
MENANSPEYLEKIKNQLIENLRRTAHVPSVQMQDVPRHSLGAMTDEDDAELDDLDEDENKDVRMTQRQWEQRIERDDEYEASDNEEMEKANGIHRNGGSRRTFQDYRNSDAEPDSGAATPTNGIGDTVIKSKETDEVVMKDVEDITEDVEAEANETAAGSKSNGKKSDPEVEATDIQDNDETLEVEEVVEASKSAKDGDKDAKAPTPAKDLVEKQEQTSKDDNDEVMQDAESHPKESQTEAQGKGGKGSIEPEVAKSLPEPDKDKDGDIDMDQAPTDEKQSLKTEATAGAPPSIETADKTKDAASSG